MSASDYTTESTLHTGENWHEIPGFEGRYQISDLGNIRRMIPMGRQKNLPAFGLLNPQLNPAGYPSLRLVNHTGQAIPCLVHRLVMLAFIGECPAGMYVNHLNGVKSDNRLVNLEYVTPSENNAHAFRTGLKKPTDKRGELNKGKVKLTDSQVMEIRRRLAEGASHPVLAREYGVSRQTISAINTGVGWSHLLDK